MTIEAERSLPPKPRFLAAAELASGGSAPAVLRGAGRCSLSQLSPHVTSQLCGPATAPCNVSKRSRESVVNVGEIVVPEMF